MRDYSELEITQDGYVTIVEIARPPHNFFDHVLIEQLADVFTEADENPDCRAIVLASQGKSFCAGANFGSGSEDSGDDSFAGHAFVQTAAKLYGEAARLFDAKTPVVAAVQGAAIGGGLGVALAADFRVVDRDTRFAANFVKLGLHQGFGISVTLPRLVGPQAAKLLLLTGRRIAGEEAVAIGLADVLAQPGEIRAAALELAREIAINAPLAVRSVRETLKGDLVDQIKEVTAHELAEQHRLRQTEDAVEGIRAVAERRAGDFSGQ